MMERHVAKFSSFEEADRADKEYYRSLTPQERIRILLELNRRWPGAEDGDARQGLQRVYRVTERP